MRTRWAGVAVMAMLFALLPAAAALAAAPENDSFADATPVIVASSGGSPTLVIRTDGASTITRLGTGVSVGALARGGIVIGFATAGRGGTATAVAAVAAVAVAAVAASAASSKAGAASRAVGPSPSDPPATAYVRLRRE